MKRRFLQISSLAAALAASSALIGPADAQIMKASLTHELARGLGGLDRTPEPGKALRRYAIVIGNQNYDRIEDLKNAGNDARVVADFLREHDFIVFDEYDVDKRRFERLLRRALLEFDQHSEVLFYFAGHGMQIGRRNYLLPTDVTLENVHDVPFETVTLDQLLALLASRTRLQLVILDSCRENPFANTRLASGLNADLFETGAGFSQAAAPINTLLSFSTSPGALALDGADGGNSPFTAAFVATARAMPGDSITRILEEVRRRVYRATDGRQVPWESSTLVEPFLFQSETASAIHVAATTRLALPPPTEAQAAAAPTDALPAPTEAQAAAAPTDALPAPTEAQAAAAPTDALPAPTEAQAAAAPTDALPAPIEAQAAAAAPAATPTEIATASNVAPEAGEASGSGLTTAAAPAATTAPREVEITTVFDRQMDVGALIAEAFASPVGGRVSVAAAPTMGSLVFAAAIKGAPAESQMASLSYDLRLEERSTAGMRDIAFTDSFEITTERDGKVEAVQVSLKTEADACDVQAGDWLDPDSVGLARYPNEIEPEAALAACEAAVARDPANGRFHYQLGRALQALRRFDAAGAAFEKARDLGHTRAWYAIGELKASLAIATGGEANVRAPDDALAHFAVGAERGDAYAMHSLGKQFLRYGKTEAEKEEGFELLSRAIEVGHTFAMNELGYYFMNKDGGHYQPERGLEYLRASAAREDIFGYNNLGLVYAGGLGGVQKDPAQALEWFEKAAAGGHPYAPANAGRLYFRGDVGAGADYAKAVALYDEGLTRGDAWGGANAAWVILNKPIEGLGPVDAAIRAAKAAALRNPGAAEAADGHLRRLPARTLTEAAQRLLNDLGAEIDVDGRYGGQTRTAIEAMAAKAGVPPDLSSSRARLLTTAKIFWRENPFRVDLY